MTTQLLDQLPVVGVFLIFAIATLACYELGFHLGRWWQARMPGEQEGPTDALVGSLLALMAFLLAVTMGMASDQFDTRRGMVLAEANAIEATYLQADYLPAADAVAIKALLREYLAHRIATDDRSEVLANIARSAGLRDQMWAVFAPVAASGYISDLMSSLGDSLTEVVNVSQSRITSGLYGRVPETVILLLLVGSVLSLGMLGYSAGLKGRRSVLSAVVLVVAMGVVLTLVIDLDRPQDGLIKVSQQPLIDVQRRIGPPTSG